MNANLTNNLAPLIPKSTAFSNIGPNNANAF